MPRARMAENPFGEIGRTSTFEVSFGEWLRLEQRIRFRRRTQGIGDVRRQTLESEHFRHAPAELLGYSLLSLANGPPTESRR